MGFKKGNKHKAKKRGVQHSLRALVNAKCKECIYDPHGGGGTWREQIEACTSESCPLFPARPRSHPTKAA